MRLDGLTQQQAEETHSVSIRCKIDKEYENSFIYTILHRFFSHDWNQAFKLLMTNNESFDS